MREIASEGGLSRAKRDHVALATARRASVEDASYPLSPTTFKKARFLSGLFYVWSLSLASHRSILGKRAVMSGIFYFWLFNLHREEGERRRQRTVTGAGTRFIFFAPKPTRFIASTPG
jgi:hypothetical protein